MVEPAVPEHRSRRVPGERAALAEPLEAQVAASPQVQAEQRFPAPGEELAEPPAEQQVAQLPGQGEVLEEPLQEQRAAERHWQSPEVVVEAGEQRCPDRPPGGRNPCA
jgi:hypothetical protein